MAIRIPLVVIAGQLQQLPAGDTVDDPAIGSQAPGSFTLATGQYAYTARLILTTNQRATLAGTARLRIG